MRKSIFGFSQKAALDMGLGVTDLMLLSIIKEKETNGSTKKKEHDGKTYVWVNYQSIIEWMPILHLGKRGLAKRLDKMCELGILEKYCQRQEGSYTYFRLAEKTQGVVTDVTGGCNTSSSPTVTPVTDKEYIVTKDIVSRKEKNNNKLLFKKKDGEKDFETVFSEFADAATKDDDFKFSLRGYNVKNYTALMETFKAHVVAQCKQSEFIDNGYMRNRTWVVRSMPHLDLSEASEIKLGYGEYIQNNKRWYINRNGTKIEVPMDAPPRKKGTIWYKEERRWGPDI